jgi:hypothetical protein
MKTTDTDLETDENLTGGGPSSSAEDLTREFVRPSSSYAWKTSEGTSHSLWSLCNGGEVLYDQVIDRVADSDLTLVLIWIFIYLKRGIPVFDLAGRQVGTRDAIEPAEEWESYLVPLAWDKIKFRGAFLRWLNSLGKLTGADKLGACRLFDEMHGWASKSAVIPAKIIGQKKTMARRQRKSHSSSTSSRKKAAASSRQNATSSGTFRNRS